MSRLLKRGEQGIHIFDSLAAPKVLEERWGHSGFDEEVETVSDRHSNAYRKIGFWESFAPGGDLVNRQSAVVLKNSYLENVGETGNTTSSL